MTTDGETPRDEIRSEVVDLIHAQFARDLTPAEQALLATHTVAERENAWQAAQGELDGASRNLAALIHDPASLLDDPVALAMLAQPPDAEGLPEHALLLMAMQGRRDWSDRDRDDVARITKGWTTGDWDLVEASWGKDVPWGFRRL